MQPLIDTSGHTTDDHNREQWERTFDTNIHPFFYLSKYSLPHMKTGSTIINCASVNPYIGRGDLLDYTSTKGAIVAFTRGLHNQQIKNGVRVNCVCPGPSMSVSTTRRNGTLMKYLSLDPSHPVDDANFRNGAIRCRANGPARSAKRGWDLFCLPCESRQQLYRWAMSASQRRCHGEWLSVITRLRVFGGSTQGGPFLHILFILHSPNGNCDSSQPMV